ncbi:alpha/beta hydrolase family protein [Flavihumibacter fluvii]|uniref:alpha/beta hydrolase family protein n=1 Tax=Flavihumibacter fluvii TaxID=2838157 RepID=UPI001BDF44D7|nr:alpha/beta hydrolase [Flavihumibacter fluvii]ULQ51851.1 alpha/beta hydrolase [Flavihumibacter fluvii]
MRGIILLVVGLLSFHAGYSQEKNNARPQTPVPPFPYTIDSLVYHSTGDSLVYGVTITKPSTSGPFPAIIFITGSGQQDRDENIFSHKPFAVLADFLTKRGFLVMRVDDRGIGLSNGDFKNSTSYDFAKDVNNHIDFLLKRKDVKKNRVGLLGHSEGGMIAPMVAASRKEIQFIILLAAPGIPIARLMAEQNEAVLKSMGVDSAAAKSYSAFFGKAMPKVAAAPDTASAKAGLLADLKDWQANEHPNRVMATTGIRDEKTQSVFLNQVVKQIYTPWFKAFLLFDPRPNLKKLTCKVLAINGGKDIQVLPASNLQGIRESLATAGNKNYTVEELPGLNHLFQTCNACSVKEYGVLTETFSPVALEKIGDWLNKEISSR